MKIVLGDEIKYKKTPASRKNDPLPVIEKTRRKFRYRERLQLERILMGKILVRNLSSVVRCWDIKGNFWYYHPELSINSTFERFRGNFRNELKEDNTSRIMWAIALIYDYDSLYKNWDREDLIQYVEQNYIKTNNWFKNNNVISIELIEEYNKLQELSLLREINRTIETITTINDRCNELISGGSIKDMQIAANILSNIPKILSDVERSSTKVEKLLTQDGEIEQKKVRGEQELSLLEEEDRKDLTIEEELI